jgi:hypothetical protein
MLGSGAGTFTSVTSYTTGYDPKSIAVTDFNGDGIKDLCVTNTNSHSVSIFEGAANGTFIFAKSYGIGAAPCSVTSNDFNGDGRMDFATANYGEDNISVFLNDRPNINFYGNSAICLGDSVAITLSGATNYTWSSGQNNSSIVLTPTTTTNYTVTGTSFLGCNDYAVKTITVNPIPVITVNTGSICSGNSFTISPSGANTYTYSGGSAIVTPNVNTSYSITGTSAEGCISANEAITTITVNSLPTITVSTDYTVFCAGQVSNLTASGANTYSWSTGQTTPQITISPTTTSTYTIYGTSTEGCQDFTMITVNVSLCTNLNELDTTSLIDAYPNPTYDKLYIKGLNKNQIITISNVIGESIMSIEITNDEIFCLNLETIIPGIYFITTQNNTLKFVKK